MATIRESVNPGLTSQQKAELLGLSDDVETAGMCEGPAFDALLQAWADAAVPSSSGGTIVRAYRSRDGRWIHAGVDQVVGDIRAHVRRTRG